MRSFLKYVFYGILSAALIGLNGLLIAQIWVYRNDRPMDEELHVDSSQAADVLMEEGAESGKPPEVMIAERKPSMMLEVASIRQHPELYNGCEITALTMVVNDYGVAKNKLSLASELRSDHTPIAMDQHGRIIEWGNPEEGFVGDITGKNMGLGVYHGPVLELMKTYIPTAQNLTGEPFEVLEQYVSGGAPVMVWTTVSFTVPQADGWVTWDSPTGEVKATFQMHTVVMVGYDDQHVYVNDPQTGEQAKKIKKAAFMDTWEAMGKQALSYIPV
ncbi:C39 family peptidase [Marinicrinis lubricantis]|uniref:C39 family peptidase n=1 Tax=Marinicrinis lubricantis TaxID=2086470 RepID=A0ABW1IKS2_9BACL